ncbi:hypothetical protein [Azotosporobacter soli]|uniref:hypothetical protein n=1 Tax=Azotosporobacter soli TaxID=3055040 RepID=UPI0031FEDC9D
MLDSIITSKTRIQMLLRFFMNPEREAYLRELASEMGDSTNGIRVELNHLAKAKLIECVSEGRTKSYRANRKHPIFPELHAIVKKMMGVDTLLAEIIERLGDVKTAFITGDYARGIDGGIIDLVLVGNVDQAYLQELVKKAEGHFGMRKIRCLCLQIDEKDWQERLKCEQEYLEIYHKE